MTEPFETFAPRDLLAKYFGKDPRLLHAFENQARVTQASAETLDEALIATEKLQDASFVTLSPNEDLNNEFILTDGDGTKLALTLGGIKIDVDGTVARCRDFAVTFVPPGPGILLFTPTEGTLISDAQAAVLYKKTLASPVIVTGLVDCDTDEEAAAAGVPINGLYRDGNVVCIRRT